MGAKLVDIWGYDSNVAVGEVVEDEVDIWIGKFNFSQFINVFSHSE